MNASNGGQQMVTRGDPRRLAGIVGALVFAGGAVSFFGRVFSIDWLKDWFGLGIEIKPNTAIGLMCVGAALVFASGAGASPTRRGIATALGAFAAALGAATLLEHLAGWSLGIDTLLFDEPPGARATAAPGRMGPPASISLLLLGTAILLTSITRPRDERRFSARSLVPAFGIGVLAISLLATCGYLFGAKSLYELAGLTGIALQTALMALMAAVGAMLIVPDREPVRTFLEAGAAGTLARRALPLVITLPILIGWLRTRGEALGLYGVETGRSLLVLALIACLCALLWWAVRGIRKSERRMRETDFRLVRERKQAEAVRARLAAIVESSEDAVVSKDLNGIITSWNASAERLFGYSEQEAVGRPVTMLMPPARSDEERLILGRIRRGERVEHYETVRQRKDGTLVDISLTVSPIRDSAGNVVGASKVARDISARKRNEEALRASEERFRSLNDRLQTLLEERTSALRESLGKLHDSQRLLALGNLAAGLGHDIANMVLPIRARLAIFEQACTTDEERGDLEAIGQTLSHLTSLSAGLRLMALDPLRSLASTDATDLEIWWSEAQGVMRASLPRAITLAGNVGPGLSVVMPRHQLTQAVFNLVRNAGEAISDANHGVVKIEAQAVTGEEGRREVAITVTDNGHGLSPEALARCFEPYFSTKGRSIATGMGLAMVRGLVESAGGTVSVRSEQGAGATFTITLPSGAPTRAVETTRARDLARSAAISVKDTRTSALAAMMLEGMGVKVFRHEPPAAGGEPDADLWVAHDPKVESVDAFIAADARRRIVVIRGPSGDLESSEPSSRLPSDRVFVVGLSSPPSELRDALSAAALTLGRPARISETRGAGLT